MAKRKTKSKHQELLWWLFIGWWWFPVKWLFWGIKCLISTVNSSWNTPTISESDYQELLLLQRIVMKDSPDELVCTKKQLLEMARQNAENSLRITQDCINILQTTANPDVFFERLQIFTSHCRTLVSLEKYISFSGAAPTEVYDTLIREKQEVIKDFLIRYLCKVNDKADSLKTAKGKLNQYQKFYDSLKPYFEEMDAANIDYIETKYRAYIRSLEK